MKLKSLLLATIFGASIGFAPMNAETVAPASMKSCRSQAKTLKGASKKAAIAKCKAALNQQLQADIAKGKAAKAKLAGLKKKRAAAKAKKAAAKAKIASAETKQKSAATKVETKRSTRRSRKEATDVTNVPAAQALIAKGDTASLTTFLSGKAGTKGAISSIGNMATRKDLLMSAIAKWNPKTQPTLDSLFTQAYGTLQQGADLQAAKKAVIAKRAQK